MKYFINLLKSILNFFQNKAHKQAKAINRAVNVETYERELDNMKSEHKKLLQDQIELGTQYALTSRDITKTTEEANNLLKKLRQAKASKDTKQFTYLAMEHKAKLNNIKALEDLSTSIKKSETDLMEVVSELELNLKRQQIKLNELKFKKKVTNTVSSTNKIIETIDISNPLSNFSDLENEVEEDFIKETLRANINKASSFNEKIMYSSEEDMDSYLSSFDESSNEKQEVKVKKTRAKKSK